MKWSELRAKCFNEMSTYASGGNVVLVLTSRKPPRGEKVALLPGGRGPRGFVLNHQRGETTACFKASAVFHWIDKNVGIH